MSHDFDRVIPRSGTSCVKHDLLDAKFGTQNVLPMWVADMDFAAPAAVTQALAARADHPVYGYSFYPESLYSALTDWLMQRHGWRIEREWIVMAPGVVPSLHAAILAFTQPGEQVLVQTPIYHPFLSAAAATGRASVINPLRLHDGRYTFDLDHFEQCAADGARLLLLCSPHNPVGRVWQAQELRELLAIARRHELLIVSDDIHADLVYPDYKHTFLATLAEAGDRVITAIAPSKTFNIPGLGLSCLIVPEASDRAAIMQVLGTLHLDNCNPFSSTAFEAAYRDGAAWLDDLLMYLRDSRDYVSAFLQEHVPQIKLIQPEGTYLLWLDCHGLNMDDKQLQDFFVQQAGVGMNAGRVFGEHGRGFMRLNMGAPRSVITLALQRIAQAVKNK